MPDPESPESPPPDPQWARAFGDLAHDLRSIAGGASIGLDALALAPGEAERERTLSMLKSSIRRIVRLAEDLRDVSDHLAGRTNQARVAHDLMLAVRRACDRLLAEAKLRRVELAFEADGLASHVVLGDPVMWDRMLERLIEAGLQFAPGRERLLVRLEARPPRTVLVVPCGSLQLPTDEHLRSAWAAPRVQGQMFGRGLWLARTFLAAEGGELAIEEEMGIRRLVATLPAR